MKKSILTKIMQKPENKISDDDHMHRKDITTEQFGEALQEIKTRHKNFKKGVPIKDR